VPGTDPAQHEVLSQSLFPGDYAYGRVPDRVLGVSRSMRFYRRGGFSRPAPDRCLSGVSWPAGDLLYALNHGGFDALRLPRAFPGWFFRRETGRCRWGRVEVLCPVELAGLRVEAREVPLLMGSHPEGFLECAVSRDLAQQWGLRPGDMVTTAVESDGWEFRERAVTGILDLSLPELAGVIVTGPPPEPLNSSNLVLFSFALNEEAMRILRADLPASLPQDRPPGRYERGRQEQDHVSELGPYFKRFLAEDDTVYFFGTGANRCVLGGIARRAVSTGEIPIVLGMIVFLLAIYGTMSAQLLEERPDLAVLKATGLSSKHITAYIGWRTLAAVLLGGLVSTVGASLLVPCVTSRLTGDAVTWQGEGLWTSVAVISSITVLAGLPPLLLARSASVTELLLGRRIPLMRREVYLRVRRRGGENHSLVRD